MSAAQTGVADRLAATARAIELAEVTKRLWTACIPPTTWPLAFCLPCPFRYPTPNPTLESLVTLVLTEMVTVGISVEQKSVAKQAASVKYSEAKAACAAIECDEEASTVPADLAAFRKAEHDLMLVTAEKEALDVPLFAALAKTNTVTVSDVILRTTVQEVVTHEYNTAVERNSNSRCPGWWCTYNAQMLAVTEKGPIGLVARALLRLNWKWESATTVTTRDGNLIDVKTIELGELGHLVRERMFFVRLSSTKTDVNAKGGGRANLRGIRAGVDKEKTLALTKSKVLSDYEAGTLRHIVADGTLTGVRLARAKLRETATCPYCAAGVDEDPKHMWWECVAWESIRTDYPLLLNIDRTNWPNCLSICGMCTPETPLATARVADLQMMMVRILIERYRQNRTQEMKPQLEQERYPWTWEPDADTTTQYPNVLGSCTLPVKKWPYGRALLLAIAYWLGGLRWSNEAGREVSHMELLIDFEVSTGMDIRPGDKTGKKPPKVKQPGNGAGGVVNGGGGGDGEMDDGGGEGGSDDGDGDDVMPEALPHNEMAKATTFGHMLSTLRTHAATPLHPGKPKIAMTLTSFGAHGLAGIDCRPVFAGGEETIRVLRALFDAGTAYRQQRKTEGMTEGEIRGNGRARGTWMGEYAAETAYPPADERGRRALRFFEQAEEENVPIRYRHDEHVKPGDAPVKAPAGAISIGPFAICVQHRKARCDACAKDQMADLRHCCYAHHSDGDGLAIRHEACTRHRLSRCGNCVRDKTTLDHCCRRHHDTAGGRQTTLGGLFSKKKQKDGHSRGGDGLM